MRGGGRCDGARRARVGVRDRPPVRAVDRGAGRHLRRAPRGAWARRSGGARGAAAGAGREPAPATGTARTGRCATCSSGSPRPARWSCAWTTCTGPTPRRSTRSRRWCAGRPPRRCCSRSPRARASCPPRWRAALAGARRARTASRALRLGAAERGRGGRARRRRRPRRSTRRPAATRSTSSSSPASRDCAAAAVGAQRRLGAAGGRGRAGRRARRARARRRARLLDAAAVAGDPFEPEPGRRGRRAARAGGAARARRAARPRARAPGRRAAPLRVPPPGRAPRRLRRDAAGGWRLGAHARAADALERRGAGPVQRAHHVEHAARPGDEDAIALLERRRDRAAVARPRPPRRASTPPRCGCCPTRQRTSAAAGCSALLADAQAAAGDPPAARATLLDALRDAPSPTTGSRSPSRSPTRSGGSAATRTRAAGCTSRSPSCRPQPSPDRDPPAARARPDRAARPATSTRRRRTPATPRDDARAIGDPVFELAALAGGALASASAADGPDAAAPARTSPPPRSSGSPRRSWRPACPRSGCTAARAARSGSSDAALADLRRGAAIAEQTGRERVAADPHRRVRRDADRARPPRRGDRGAARTALERARLAGNPRMLLWAHCALAAARLAAGDVAGGAATTPARRRALDTPAGLPRRRATRLVPRRGADRRRQPRAAPCAVMLDAFGGPDLPRVLPADRPAAAADLVEAQLAARRHRRRRARARLRAGRRRARRHAHAAAVTGIARAAVLLARERPRDAAAAAAGARGRRRRAADLARARGSPRAGRSPPPATRRAAVEALIDAEIGASTASERCAGATRPRASCGASATASCARAPRRPTAPADRARARDRRARRRRPHQPRDRRAARPQHPHDRSAPAQHLRQARRPLTRRTRTRLPAQRALRLTLWSTGPRCRVRAQAMNRLRGDQRRGCNLRARPCGACGCVAGERSVGALVCPGRGNFAGITASSAACVLNSSAARCLRRSSWCR